MKAAWYSRTNAIEWGVWTHDIGTFMDLQTSFLGSARFLLPYEEGKLLLYVAPVPIRSGDEPDRESSLANRKKAMSKMDSWLDGYATARGTK